MKTALVVVTAYSYKHSSPRKQPTFRDTTTGFPANWRLMRNERRKSILITRHYPNLGKFSTSQKHKPDLGSDVSLTSFGGETSSGNAKCRLFSQAINILKESKLRHYLCSFCPQKAQKLSSQLAFRPHFVQKCIDAGLSSSLGELEPALALLGGEANTASIEKG